MAMAAVLSRAQHGMDAPLVRVEADIGSGNSSFAVVGLPEAVVKESKDRVRAAIQNCHFEFPHGRVTVNLSPVDLPKEGGRFDLPIALGVLLAAGRLPNQNLTSCELYGELSLSGEVRPVRGVLLAALAATRAGQSMILPPGNGAEASLVERCELAVATHLLDVVKHVSGSAPLKFARGSVPPPGVAIAADLCDVRGQAHARRALEIAA